MGQAVLSVSEVYQIYKKNEEKTKQLVKESY